MAFGERNPRNLVKSDRERDSCAALLCRGAPRPSARRLVEIGLKAEGEGLTGSNPFCFPNSAEGGIHCAG